MNSKPFRISKNCVDFRIIRNSIQNQENQTIEEVRIIPHGNNYINYLH